MAWDKKHYNSIYKFAYHWLSHKPFFHSYKGTPASHIEFMLTQIPEFVKAQDCEAAQATKDAIINFYNFIYREDLAKDVLLNIPEWKEQKLPPHHLSYARCKKSGM